MKTIYYRIFYCIFKGLKRSYKEDDKTVAIISSIYFSILLFMNIYTALLLITTITKSKAYHFSLLLLLFVLPILNIVLFLRKKKYLQINDMFKQEEKKLKQRRKVLCVFYIIISLISTPIMLYIVGTMGLYD